MVISSDSSDAVLTDNADTINQLDHKDPMIRFFALGRVSRLMRKYQTDKGEGSQLTENGHRLLKGFYTANKMELEGDIEDHFA